MATPRIGKVRSRPTTARIPLILRKQPSSSPLYGCRCRRGRGQDDAEIRQPAGVITNEPVSVQSVEVIVSEVPVRPAVPEKVPRDDEDRVARGNDAFLVAAPACDPVILRCQIAVSGPDGAPGALDQRRAQPAVAFTRLARLAFPRAFIVARADAGPGGGVGRRRKAAHVVAEFGQDLLGTAAGHAGDGVEPLQRGAERTRLGLDPGIEERDLPVQELNVAEQTLEHEGVVISDATDQRLAQLRFLLPQESPRARAASFSVSRSPAMSAFSIARPEA